jgi:hypothetical protein
VIPEPYENVYIGAFVFALGYAAREKNMRPTDTYAQLLQQTPGDRPLGDLLTSWEGRSFVFEFKRREAGLQSERKKCY